MAYTRKYGYASNLSNPVTFGIGENPDRFLQNNDKEIYFAFKDLNKDNLISTFSSLPDLIALTAGSFVFGLLLTLILKSLIDGKKKGRKEKEVEEIIVKKKKGNEEGEKTLRELLGGKEEENTEKEEIKREPSIINKDVFLRKYKRLDPDLDSGKENDSEKIKVSLTSKEED